LQVTPVSVKPKIVELPDFMLTVYKSDEDYTPNFWNKYNCKKLSKRLSGGMVCADYGVCRWNSEASKLDYFIGILTEYVNGDTTGTTRLGVSGGLYTMFSTPQSSHFDFVNTIHKTWQYIFNVWLPGSKYRYASDHGDQFETYIETDRTFSEDIYIPIEVKPC
ncbi:MAG TPA: DNA-binding protein, partial [Clostridiales bacterium]|nr:DNA-binding protein [Clostridiales bacterium]